MSLDLQIDADLIKTVAEQPVVALLVLSTVVLAVLLILIVHDPDRVDKFKAAVLRPLYRYCRIGVPQYLAAKVGSTATTLLQRHVVSLLEDIESIKVQIRWVTSARDPILEEDGNLILFIREDNDQTLNILNATRAALPRVVCPALRGHISSGHEHAIDLAILRRFAAELGSHARPLFKKHFLNPETERADQLRSLFEELVEIDNHGLLVSVFLNELNRLGENVFSSGSQEDKTEEIEAFLKYLLQIPRRARGEEIRLRHLTADFKVSIMIVAKSVRAELEGPTPYIQRVHKELRAGSESLYLLAYEPAFGFIKRLVKILEGDERVWLGKSAILSITDKDSRRSQIRIVALRRNDVFIDVDFSAQVEARDLSKDTEVVGTVIDVSPTVSIVDVAGLTGRLRKDECSWYDVRSCEDHVRAGEERHFLISGIEAEKGMMDLSMRFAADDPWAEQTVPGVGDSVQVVIDRRNLRGWLGRHLDNKTIEVDIPETEMSWFADDPHFADEIAGRVIDVIIIERDDERRRLVGSIKALSDNPWPELQKTLPGHRCRAIVRGVTQNTVLVELASGLPAFIRDEDMKAAGFEYADYQDALAIGSGLDVIVDRVFVARRTIRVNLQRNVNQMQT